MATRTILLAALAAAISFPGAALAHHSTSGRFDRDKTVEIEGDVTEVQWRNPHSHVIINVAGEDGERVSWDLETGSVTQLRRVGIRPEWVSVGDHIKVAGWPPLTSTREMFATNLLTADGKELLLNISAEPRWSGDAIGDPTFQSKTEGDPSRPELGLFRIWSHTDVSVFLFPEDTDRDFDLSRYPLTDAARSALRGFDRATDNPTRHCMPKGMPTIMEQPYPMQILEEENGDVRFLIEEYDTQRLIHMNEQAPPPNVRPSRLGYSVGRWEGNSLVVTTTQMSWPWFDQVGIPQSNQSVLLERFTPTDDGSRLDYTLTVTDPVNFTAPVHLEKYWLYLPGRQVRPYECTD
jgi:hypothetical protein